MPTKKKTKKITKASPKKKVTKKSVPAGASKTPEKKAKSGAKAKPSQKKGAKTASDGASVKPPVAKVKRMTKAQTAAVELSKKLADKWQSLHRSSKGIKPAVYDMKKTYEENIPLQHKVLGWGYVLSNVNNRLEVLFEDGIKVLISNYKAK